MASKSILAYSTRKTFSTLMNRLAPALLFIRSDLKITLQPEIIANLILKTLFHVTRNNSKNAFLCNSLNHKRTGWLRNRTGTGNRNRRNRFSRNRKWNRNRRNRFSRNRNRNRPFLLNCTETQKKTSLQRNRRNRELEPL